ncbi:hypothetical protein DH2020_020699 [Rehmannia glutinosa]|uniref:Acyl-[acyl-carrier-protein] hydrolase n=1 Tax=Rehmannia glutinosa TaxID=99300 RepID=A0ABR0WL12_REHGL
MAAISCHMLSYFTHCSSNKSSQEPNKQKLHSVKINGTKHVMAFPCVDNPPAKNVRISIDGQIRQNIPTKKQLVDPYRLGVFVEDGVEYRQTVVVRSHEVGPDKTMTIESILNLLQEYLNAGNSTESCMDVRANEWVWNHLWGEVIETNTWVGASGKNGMRRDWLLRSQATGLVLARATSKWVMMNKHTRRLSKMPDDVRTEISPWFIEKQAMEESTQEIEKMDSKNACYVHSDLKPKRSDLDMNHHVNYVKYVKWMIETLPGEFLENHQLSDIVLEYKRECGSSDMVQSLCQPQQHHKLLKTTTQQCGYIGVDGNSVSSDKLLKGNGRLGSLNQGPFSYTHLLQIKGDPKNGEIVRGKTTWKETIATMPFRP